MERWYSGKTKVFDLPALRRNGVYVHLVFGAAGSSSPQ
jgi:hypothetical protein